MTELQSECDQLKVIIAELNPTIFLLKNVYETIGYNLEWNPWQICGKILNKLKSKVGRDPVSLRFSKP